MWLTKTAELSTRSHRDPYGNAAREAVLQRVLSALLPTPAAASLGITALLGLFLAWRGNAFLKQQNYLVESQRRASLIFELSSILDEVDEELDATPPEHKFRSPQPYTTLRGPYNRIK